MIRSVLLVYCLTAEQAWSQSGLMLKGCHKLSFDSLVALILMPIAKLVTLWVNCINNRQIPQSYQRLQVKALIEIPDVVL